jgi:hypothetical protein
MMLLTLYQFVVAMESFVTLLAPSFLDPNP